MARLTRRVEPRDPLAGLKDFQRATAAWVFERMYLAEQPSLRFLVADEVGLGKTLVARGVIAQVVEHLRELGDERHDIVYVCSNAAIARQNLRKLNPTSSEALTLPTRFTMLGAHGGRLRGRRVNLVAITPGTSFQLGNHPGTFTERALAFALLRQAWGPEWLQGSGPARVFHLGIADDQDAQRRLHAKRREFEPLDDMVVTNFRTELDRLDAQRRGEGRPLLGEEFDELADVFRYRRSRYDNTARRQRNRLVGEIRQAMASVGIKALQPDLVILDEFQRFKSLLNPDDQSWATRLARDLFTFRDPGTGRPTRTLLLSATPYRMLTLPDDGASDDHYADFIETCRFLFDDDNQTRVLQGELRSFRGALLAARDDGGATARVGSRAVGARLRQVMVRTERLAATPDRNGMLRHVHANGLELRAADVRGYRNLARIATELDQGDLLEYWKSSPYLLNFMEGYTLDHAFQTRTASGEPLHALSAMLHTGDGLLPWDDICRYREIDPGNARLRALLDDVITAGAWRLLWLPPALAYYATGTEFDDPAARQFTKRLVFSAWRVVPKVISALLSYEAERRMLAGDPIGSSSGYRDYTRRPGQLLEYRMEAGRPAGMTTLAVVYPSATLAECADPRTIAADLRATGRQPHKQAVLDQASKRIKARLRPLILNRSRSGAVDARWYWAAPILLDLLGHESTLTAWLMRADAHTAWTGTDDEADPERFKEHVKAAQQLCRSGGRVLGRVPDDLPHVLAEFAVGGPAVVALRALARVESGPGAYDDTSAVRAAARLAWGFRSLFNIPDTTALVRGRVEGDLPYWRAVLTYAIDGNLQAVLDEYLHVLRDWQGFVGDQNGALPSVLAEVAFRALTLRSPTYRTDVPVLHGRRIEVERHGMRGRFATRFGDERTEEGTPTRADQVSDAFNSPFWPFVLATTSIGQEGLDFHLYCHAVVHWNLPYNPVDLEQREGRVHRFKGHAVRKNIARACGAAGFQPGTPDPWAAMFAEAARRRSPNESEIVPYWVFNPGGDGAVIERHVPMLPLSKETSRFDALLRALATYRLAFGQPRQDELLHALLPQLENDTLARALADGCIDLSPPPPKPTPP